MAVLTEHIEKIMERIENIKIKAGRKSETIEILGATKGIDIERIQKVVDQGVTLLGENTVQSAEKKIPKIKGNVEWHMIGHLQRNKAKKAARIFQMIQSLDSLPLSQKINTLGKNRREKISVLIEINTSGEFSKYGFKPGEILSVFSELVSLRYLNIQGLFTIGPYPPEERNSRVSFSKLREIGKELEKEFGVRLPVLSMGMSEDYEYAIMEGATMIRLGRLLFGERKQRD